MIKKGIAQDFINRLDYHIDYNVNIIDEDGIIIASRDRSRVGVFHEAAYRLIRENEEIESIGTDQSLPLGVRPGINLPVVSEGKIIGVVGVTGDPDKINDLAYALKTSVEMLIELEYYKDRLSHRHNRKNLFFSYLLTEEPYRQAEVERLASVLGYDVTLVRVPVLIPLEQEIDGYELISAIKETDGIAVQDMSFITPDGALLIFRHLKVDSASALESFRAGLEEFAALLFNGIRQLGAGSPPPVFIGAPQDHMEYYRTAYRQTQWLVDRLPASTGGIFFFLDHMQHYFLSRIPREEFISSFRVFYSLLDRPQRTTLFHTVNTLSETNLNIKEAASRLGVHRNTITARLEKIREIFGVDIINNPRGKDFMFLMIAYDQLLGHGTIVHDAQ